MVEQLDLMTFLVAGGAGTVVLSAGFVLWRAWRNGVWYANSGVAHRPWRSWQQDRGQLKLVHSAVLAANAHNTQPWQFGLASHTITIFADPGRHIGSFDPFRREMHLSLGCALENLCQAARAQGLQGQIELPAGKLALAAPPAGPAAIVRLIRGQQLETELFWAIPNRHTHRGAYQLDRDIPGEVLAEMQAAVPSDPPLRLYLFSGQERKQLAQLIVSATEAIVTDREMSKDNARWLRFDQTTVEQMRDGLTLDTNVTVPLQNFAAKIFPPSPERADRYWLRDTKTIQLDTAPLVGMIAVRDLYDRPTALAAGRLWQRLHLLLTARGLAGQPLNQPVELVDRERELGLVSQMAESLAKFTGDASWCPTIIFRAGYGVRPSCTSPRRPVESVLIAGAPNAAAIKPGDVSTSGIQTCNSGLR